MMAHYNSFGPKPLESSHENDLSQVMQTLTDNYSPDKWLVASLFGLCGGGIAYFFYKRRTRSQGTCQRSNRQQPNRNTDFDSEFSCIGELPPEIRSQIWNAVSYEDLLNLRLTSQFTKYDVDTVVGLNGRITSSDPEKYDFFQKIALQSCKITELESPIDQDFFLNPNVLTCLEIREHSLIPLENIRAILAVSSNLKHLKVRLTLNDDTGGISNIILENLPSMKNLTHLHIKTRIRYSTDTKIYTSSPANFQFSTPKLIKCIHLEMPDLPESELSKWKCVLDKQINLQRFTSTLGNVRWRFYEQVLTQNSATLENLAIEGIRGWNEVLGVEDPFDWNIFSDYVALKSVDLTCCAGGEHDLVATINFATVPCANIEEFFVSRIILPPEAVDKVYTEMVNLQRGALDHIGNAGLERANENAWLVRHEDERRIEGWLGDERLWDFCVHGLMGVGIAMIIVFAARTGSNVHSVLSENFLQPDKNPQLGLEIINAQENLFDE